MAVAPTQDVKVWKNYIGGEWVEASSGDTFEVLAVNEQHRHPSHVVSDDVGNVRFDAADVGLELARILPIVRVLLSTSCCGHHEAEKDQNDEYLPCL